MAQQALMTDGQDVTQAQLEALAAQLANTMTQPRTLCLHGGLGAGKSTFARAFLRARGVEGDIPSPTFTLLQVYDGCGPMGSDIWHVDAYRLTDPAEAEPLGLLEAFDTATCLIEWPENLGYLMPPHCLHIRLDITDRDEARRVSLEDTLL